MLNVSNIQHFSVGDGSGIRTTVFLKGCNLRCPWCHNPENLSAKPTVLCYKATGKTEILGKYMTEAEILCEVLEDKDYYVESGGGVTLSGGEAMLQADELVTLVALLKENDVSTLIDTAGCVPYASFEKINPYVCGYLFDFKTADEQKYKEIGGDLSLVSENIIRLREAGMQVTIRIPLIPGFNTDADSKEAICMHLKKMGIEHVDLIPFHRLGSAKYEAMGLVYPYKDQKPFDADELCEIENTYKQYFSIKTER